MTKHFTIILSLLCVSFIFQAAPATASGLKKSDADYVIESASTKTHSMSAWCKKHDSVKIWVEGSSTAHFSDLKCKAVTIHVEGASTLCMTGTYIKKLNRVIEGSSTVNVTSGLVRHVDGNPTGGSTYNSYAAGSVPCGILGPQ